MLCDVLVVVTLRDDLFLAGQDGQAIVVGEQVVDLLSRLLRLFRVEGGEREGNNLWARDCYAPPQLCKKTSTLEEQLSLSLHSSAHLDCFDTTLMAAKSAALLFSYMYSSLAALICSRPRVLGSFFECASALL